MDTDMCISFWSKLIRVDGVTQNDQRIQKRKHRKNYYGVITVRICKSLGLKEALEEFSYSRSKNLAN